MEQAFWQERWTTRQIGFHQPHPNELLVAHAPLLDGLRRIYVPLCGKSTDLAFLRRRGHVVVGSEFVGQAIAELFGELGETPVTARAGPFRTHTVPQLTILEGDALLVEPDHAGGKVDGIYDRAALVAVAPADRVRLVASYRPLLQPGGRLLVIVFDYEQSRLKGPPWAVSRDQIAQLFGDLGRVRLLGERTESPSERFAAAGVTQFIEQAWAVET
jgi:thiopurine S-methyltransferase